MSSDYSGNTDQVKTLIDYNRTMLSYDNTKNADITTDNKQLREQTKCQKVGEGKGGQRKRKLFCCFLLGAVFLAKSGLKLDLLPAMGAGILPHTCSCSQAAPAC